MNNRQVRSEPIIAATKHISFRLSGRGTVQFRTHVPVFMEESSAHVVQAQELDNVLSWQWMQKIRTSSSRLYGVIRPNVVAVNWSPPPVPIRQFS